jgi:hypothetical protein
VRHTPQEACRCHFNPRPSFSATCPQAAHRVAASDAAMSRSNYELAFQRNERQRHVRTLVEAERLVRRMKQARGVRAEDRYGHQEDPNGTN